MAEWVPFCADAVATSRYRAKRVDELTVERGDELLVFAQRKQWFKAYLLPNKSVWGVLPCSAVHVTFQHEELDVLPPKEETKTAPNNKQQQQQQQKQEQEHDDDDDDEAAAAKFLAQKKAAAAAAKKVPETKAGATKAVPPKKTAPPTDELDGIRKERQKKLFLNFFFFQKI